MCIRDRDSREPRRRCLDLSDRLGAEASPPCDESMEEGPSRPPPMERTRMCCTGTPATPPMAARASSDETLLGPALAPSSVLASAELAGRRAPAGTRSPRDDPRGAEEVVPRPLPIALALPGTQRDARARVGVRLSLIHI